MQLVNSSGFIRVILCLSAVDDVFQKAEEWGHFGCYIFGLENLGKLEGFVSWCYITNDITFPYLVYRTCANRPGFCKAILLRSHLSCSCLLHWLDAQLHTILHFSVLDSLSYSLQMAKNGLELSNVFFNMLGFSKPKFWRIFCLCTKYVRLDDGISFIFLILFPCAIWMLPM